jgi:hypothetical protein
MDDEHVMANYFPVVVGPVGHQWLVSLLKNHVDSWYALRQAFVENFIATYEQPDNKYDLQCIHDARDEPLREYIQRFSDMRIRIPRITDNEAIEAFITGLRYHNDLRDKLLRKRPITVVDLLTTAKYADADDTKKLLYEGTSKAPYSPRHDDYRDNRHRDDFRGRSDIRDRRNDNSDRRDNRNQHDEHRDNFKGKRARDDDGEVNAVKKFGGCCNYEEDYAKALKGPCPPHPKSNHTLENCKVLKEIYRRKQASENAAKPDDATDQRNRRDDDKDDPDKNPKQQYQESVRHIATIVGGKMSVESKRERKLLARACLNVAKTDDLIADPRLPPWSHREINFSRADQWATIPKLGRFALVLSPCINKVQFDRVLIDSGSSIDILFKNSLSALNISEADLKPYDA